MTAMTMSNAAARFAPKHSEGVKHLPPLLVAMALLAASALVSVLLSGPMH